MAAGRFRAYPDQASRLRSWSRAPRLPRPRPVHPNPSARLIAQKERRPDDERRACHADISSYTCRSEGDVDAGCGPPFLPAPPICGVGHDRVAEVAGGMVDHLDEGGALDLVVGRYGGPLASTAHGALVVISGFPSASEMTAVPSWFRVTDPSCGMSIWYENEEGASAEVIVVSI